VSIWQSFFGWPAGGVWPNLLASVMWGAPAFVTHHVLIRRHQARTTARQTEQLKDHIDARLDQQQGGAP
jgi:hypothetical protein